MDGISFLNCKWLWLNDMILNKCVDVTTLSYQNEGILEWRSLSLEQMLGTTFFLRGETVTHPPNGAWVTLMLNGGSPFLLVFHGTFNTVTHNNDFDQKLIHFDKDYTILKCWYTTNGSLFVVPVLNSFWSRNGSEICL